MGKRLTRCVSSIALVLVAALAAADEYADARAELVQAYQAGDFASMVVAAERAVAARPDHPGAKFNLALANTLNDDADAAFEALGLLIDIGIDFDIANLGEFERLREHEKWPGYAKRVAELNEPRGEASIAARFDDGHFVPEGIAVDEDGSLYLGSIRKGQLVRVSDNIELVSDRAGHWSVFGMRFDDSGDLWFASAAVPQFDGAGDALGRSGLYRVDTDSGEIKVAAELPQQAEQHVLGDLVIAGDDVYTTDSIGGALYRYDIATDEFHTVIGPGRWVSPQGLVLDARGESMYVADYASGLYRVSLDDGAIVRLAVAKGISDYGIDGLYRWGNDLIVIQNGIRPHRVVALTLSDDGLAVIASRTLASNLPEFDEPTLGTVVGDEFWFVANSHWNRFDLEDQLPDGLSGPIILKVRLPSQD